MQLINSTSAVALCMLVFMCTCTMASPTDAVKNDTRLDKKITLELGLVTLEKFVKEFSRATGVKVTAGDSARDWQVKERKTIIYAKDVYAKDILVKVAKLHHYTLSRYGKDDNPTYCYWQDLKGRQEEENLRLQMAMEPLKQCLESLNEMASLRNAGDKMNPEELAKIEKTDPYKHFLLADPRGKAMCGIAAEIPAYVWTSPSQWTITLDSSVPGLHSAIQNYMTARNDQMSRMTGSQQQVNEIPNISFELTSENDGIYADGHQELGFLGRIELNGGSEIELYSKDSDLRGIVAAEAKAIRDGIIPSTLDPDQLGIKFPEPLDDTPLKDDPILKETVKIEKEDEADPAAWLRAIHKKTGLMIISDSYWEPLGKFSGEITIKDILNRFAILRKSLLKEDSALIMSNKRWYDKRSADIPDSLMERYTKKATESGLILEDVLQIALDLNDTQIKKNLLLRELFKEYSMYLDNPKQLAGLRFLSFLTPEQKSVMSESALLKGNGRPILAEELPTDALWWSLQAVERNVDDITGKKLSFYDYFEATPETGGIGLIRIKMDLVNQDETKETLCVYVNTPGFKPREN
ncbi:MAG: hypothetical protein ACYC27_22970 [Armatimonadota bacterium]